MGRGKAVKKRVGFLLGIGFVLLAFMLTAATPARAEYRAGARIDIATSGGLVFYRDDKAGLVEGLMYEVRLMPFDQTIGAIRIVEITPRYTRAEILDGYFKQYEGEMVSFVPVQQEPPEEGPKVIRVPLPEPEPEPEPVVVSEPPKPKPPPEPPEPKTLADMPEYALTLQNKVKQDRRPSASIMFRYENYRQGRELFYDDTLYTQISFTRPYAREYVGSFYFGYRDALDGGDAKGYTYGVSFSKLYNDLQKLTLDIAQVNEDFDNDALYYLDDDYSEIYYSLTWSKTMKAVEDSNYGIALSYVLRTGDADDQDAYFRFNYNFYMNRGYFGRLSYVHSYSIEEGESLTNQYIFAFGKNINERNRLTAEYVKVDMLYDDFYTFLNRDDESSTRITFSHLF